MSDFITSLMCFGLIVLPFLIWLFIVKVIRPREDAKILQNSSQPILSFDSFVSFYNVAPTKWLLQSGAVTYTFKFQDNFKMFFSACKDCQDYKTCIKPCRDFPPILRFDRQCTYYFLPQDLKKYEKWYQNKQLEERLEAKHEDLVKLKEAVRKDINKYKESILKESQDNLDTILENLKEKYNNENNSKS